MAIKNETEDPNYWKRVKETNPEKYGALLHELNKHELDKSSLAKQLAECQCDRAYQNDKKSKDSCKKGLKFYVM